MTKETGLLKVGDTIYRKERSFGITQLFKIERVTKTQAISGDVRFKIEWRGKGGVSRISDIAPSWSGTTYWLEAEELKAEYARQNAIGIIKTADYKTLSTALLLEIAAKITAELANK